MVRVTLCMCALGLGPTGSARGQVPFPLEGVVGIGAPEEMAVEKVPDAEWAKLLSSVEVLSEGLAASQGVRVPHAGLDAGALSSWVFIASNKDGFDFSAHRIGPLLDPEVRRITTEASQGVVYLVYALGTRRQCARVKVLPRPVTVSQPTPDQCPVD